MFDFNVDTGEIFLYDAIGPAEFWGMETGMIDAKMVQEAIAAIGNKKITLRINSPGGVVDEAIGIYNMLERHSAGVVTAIDSMAASSASFLSQVGTSRTMAKNGVLMVHKPWSWTEGNATDMRKVADVLDTYEGRIKSMYRTTLSDEDLSSAIEAETWYTAQQALDAGLIDEIVNYQIEEPAKVPKNLFRNTPAAWIKQTKPKAKEDRKKNIKTHRFGI